MLKDVPEAQLTALTFTQSRNDRLNWRRKMILRLIEAYMFNERGASGQRPVSQGGSTVRPSIQYAIGRSLCLGAEAGVLLVMMMGTALMAQSDQGDRPAAGRDLAQTILQDERLDAVVRMGHELLKTGMNAGSGYSEVWIRDLNTFVAPLLDVAPRESVRDALLTFFQEFCPSCGANQPSIKQLKQMGCSPQWPLPSANSPNVCTPRAFGAKAANIPPGVTHCTEGREAGELFVAPNRSDLDAGLELPYHAQVSNSHHTQGRTATWADSLAWHRSKTA